MLSELKFETLVNPFECDHAKDASTLLTRLKITSKKK
jgi:hypothetical protein